MVDLIRHYIQHGDQSCAKCRKGFQAYWIQGERS
jgi:hypothetical protein